MSRFRKRISFLALVWLCWLCQGILGITCGSGTYQSTQTLQSYNLGIGNGDLNYGTGPTTCTYATPQSALGSVALTASVNGNSIPQGVQTWTVGSTGTYFIVAAGAAGAASTYSGGSGIVVSATYTFTKGQTVAISVGESPGYAVPPRYVLSPD